MKLLTVENSTFEMNEVPEEVDDIRFCVIDYTDPKDPDYIFIPLLFLESFNSPAIDLRLGNHRIQMPLDWSIIIGDKNTGELEILSLKQLNDRSFEAFSFNPISGYMPEFQEIEILNVFPDVKWYFPKLKYGHLLAVPIENCAEPKCCFFVKDANKIPELLDITSLV